MRREIEDVYHPGNCCPGHDDYPSDTYRNRRSIKRRAKDIKKEHRHARRVKKMLLNNSLKEEIHGM